MSKLTSAGSFGWAERLGGGGIDAGSSIAVDGSGNVYTTGAFSGTADFDPGSGTTNLTSAGLSDVFVSKLTSAGALGWAKGLGGSGIDTGVGIAVDGSGNVYTTGAFSGTADFDPGSGTANLTSAGGTDVFVSRLDGAGALALRVLGGRSTARRTRNCLLRRCCSRSSRKPSHGGPPRELIRGTWAP